MKYITIAEAAESLEVSVQAVYQAIRRRNLKAKIKGRRMFTSYEWLREYMEHWASKQEHSRFNGEKVFNKDKGEYSVVMVAQELGVKTQLIHDMCKEGKIKTYRKSTFLIISKEELERVKESILSRHQKSA